MESNFTHLNAVVKALTNLGGGGFLQEIYDEFEKVCKEENIDLSTFNVYKGTNNFKATVRRELQHNARTSDSYVRGNPDLFIGPNPKKRGYWEIRKDKRCAYISAFYFSQFLDHNNQKNYSYESLGFSSRKEAIDAASETFNVLPSNISNFEDSFDSVNDNHRKGWYQKPISKIYQDIIDIYGDLSKDELQRFVKIWLNVENNIKTSKEEDKLIEKYINDGLKKSKKLPKKINEGNINTEFHDKQLKILEDGFKNHLDFDLVESKISMGQGDIDLLVTHENTLIIIELKCGKTNIRSEFINFNGKKSKYFRFLTQKFGETARGKSLEFDGTKYNKIVHLFVVSRYKRDHLIKLRKDYAENGILVREREVIRRKDYKFEITSNEIFHFSRLKSYFDSGKMIDPKYSSRDFLKDINVRPEDKSTMVVPSLRILNINAPNEENKLSEPYDIYLFTCSAKKFMEFASVSRRIPGPGGEDNAYQRLLTGSRLKTIGENFIDKGGFFANNIIVKLNSENIKFNSLQKVLNSHYEGDEDINQEMIDSSTSQNSEFGLLEIKENYHSAWIIDGQHRLFSYLKSKDPKIIDNINVAGLVGLSDKEEINYFVDINDNATTVPKDLIWDLNGIISKKEIEGIISNVGKIIDKTSIVEDGIELNPLKDKLKIPSIRKRAKFSYGGLCRTFYDDNNFKNFRANKKVRRWYGIDSNSGEFKNLINPFFKYKDPEMISKKIASSYVAFISELNKSIIKHSSGNRDGSGIYISDGMVSIILRIAQHYFNFHKSDKIKNEDSFFDIFGKILTDYTLDDIKNFSAQTSSDKGKAAVESNLLIDIIDKYDETFYKREPSKLVDNVQRLVEPSFSRSFGELIYKIIKIRYGVNFVTSSANFSKDLKKLRIRGASDGRVKSDDDLYKLLLFKERIIEGVCYKEKFPLKLEDKSFIEVDCYKDFFEEIIIANQNTNLGYRSKSHFIEALQNLTDYKSATSSHGGKDLYNSKQRKMVEASYSIIRQLVDDAFDKYENE